MTQAFDQAFAFTHTQENGAPDRWILSTLEGEDAETFSGIYRKAHPSWAGWALIDAGDTSSDQLKQMVRDFYFKEVWVRFNCEQLPFPLSALVYDFAVNSDSEAILELQKLLPVKVDGLLGGATAAAARGLDGAKLNMRYIAARLDFMNDLKNWKINSGGWSQRIVELLKFAAQ